MILMANLVIKLIINGYYCRLAQEARLLRSLEGDKQHFVDGPDFYSMADLVDTHSGKLVGHSYWLYDSTTISI